MDTGAGRADGTRLEKYGGCVCAVEHVPCREVEYDGGSVRFSSADIKDASSYLIDSMAPVTANTEARYGFIE